MKTWNDFGIEINTHVNGKGEILTTCPKCSPIRKKKNAKCLSVNIEKNVWHCNHCDWSGTLNQGEQKTSRPYYEEKPKIYLKPTPKTNINPSQKIIDWFARRKISEDTLIKMKVTNGLNWMPAVEDYVNTIEFNYFKNGELVNIKYRDKNKNFKQHRDAEKIFYNIDGIEDQREIIIVEGEIDVLSFIEAGIDNVISVPDGAPAIGTKNFSSKFDYLENYKSLFENIGLVVLACDNDGPGMLLTDELARRIGKEKCYLVKWPEGCKDANDVLVKYSKEKLMSCITSMYPYPINGIIEVNQLHENIYNIYEHGFKRGLSTGWSCLNKFYTVRPGELTIVSGIPSHGKALSIDTEILTINGFKKMEDIHIGNIIYNEKGEETKVIGETEIMYGRPCYEITFDNGIKIIADENHQWFTVSERARRSIYVQKLKRNGREETKPKGLDQRWKITHPSLVTTKEISETIKSQGKNNHHIPLCGKIKGRDNNLLIKPYTLGCWLGDGRNDYGSITISEIEIIERIKKDQYKIYLYPSSKIQYNITGLTNLLKHYNLINNKRIPRDYLYAKTEDRMELLKGLMDTDGTCMKDSRCEYTSIKKDLAEDVLFLVNSLGIRGSLVIGDAKLYGRFISKKYRVCFVSNFQVFNLSRKIQRQRINHKIMAYRNERRVIVSCEKCESVPVKCIKVSSESGLYLASKSLIPTHNSEMLDALTINLARNEGWRFGMFSPENYPVERHIVKLVEKYTGYPFRPGMTERISKECLNDALDWIDEHYYFMSPEEDQLVKIDKILELSRVLIYRKGINGIVIDPWNEIDHSRPNYQTETEYVSDCLSRIRRFSRTNDVHIWLVAHPTKLHKGDDGKEPVPTAYDISGSSHFRNKADNCITVYRDLINNTSNVEIHIQKVRFKEVGEIGLANLIYNKINGCYRE